MAETGIAEVQLTEVGCLLRILGSVKLDEPRQTVGFCSLEKFLVFLVNEDLQR